MTLTQSARFFHVQAQWWGFFVWGKRRRKDATVAVALKISKTGRGPFTSFPFSFFRPPPHFRNAFFFLSLHTYTYAQGEHCGTSNCLLPFFLWRRRRCHKTDVSRRIRRKHFCSSSLLLLLHTSFSSSSFCSGRVARSLQPVEGDQILSVFFFSFWTGFSELEIRGDVS